jgi:uncharacterized SAM-binding protein YcdF (DUF218 family)
MIRLPRTPEVPNLEPHHIENITKTVFYSNPTDTDPDVIFVFGSPARNWDFVVEAAKKFPKAYILTTGDRGLEENSVRFQGIVIQDYLIEKGIDPKRILVECSSTNTLENVLNGLKILRQNAIHPKHVLFCSKHHHSGRCFRTLKKYLPDVQISNWWQESSYDGKKITKDRWHTHLQGKQRVYGEYLRIQHYTKKGDISA